MDNLRDGLVSFVDAPSFVFYTQRIGMNAIENDMKMIVLSVAVQCKNGQMIAAHTEMPFQNFYGSLHCACVGCSPSFQLNSQ